MEERRRSRRVAAHNAELTLLSLSMTVQVLDISLAGVLLQSSRLVEAGARGCLRLSLGGTPFSADVTVQRVVPSGSLAGGYRLGATFVAISPEHRQVIQRFTSQ
jgi:PilZ domain